MLAPAGVDSVCVLPGSTTQQAPPGLVTVPLSLRGQSCGDLTITLIPTKPAQASHLTFNPCLCRIRLRLAVRGKSGRRLGGKLRLTSPVSFRKQRHAGWGGSSSTGPRSRAGSFAASWLMSVKSLGLRSEP